MQSEPTPPLLRLERLTKLFGTVRAIDDLSLDINRGEVFSLLGPSGCGKSTTLRQIAGLDEPDSGRITLNGGALFSSEDGTFVPPQKRNMGMVFQSYAIWPHLTVFETVAYPLRLRKIPSTEIQASVERVIQLVGLGGLAQRPTTNLSGGQQQRVALARALVYKPDVLLLDEPFSNLDDKLRKQMRVELKILQRQLGVTVILVTHDQSEALSLSDRIAIMNSGKIEQIGDPVVLYEKPETPFVRDFIGQTTKIPVVVTVDGGADTVQAKVASTDTPLAFAQVMSGVARNGMSAIACIRPESIRVGRAVKAREGNVIDAGVEALLFLGDHYECVLDLSGTKIMAIAPSTEELKEGQTVPLQFPKEALALWPQ